MVSRAVGWRGAGLWGGGEQVGRMVKIKQPKSCAEKSTCTSEHLRRQTAAEDREDGPCALHITAAREHFLFHQLWAL